MGRNILYYHSRQTEQVNLNCREVERVIVPIFKRLENDISNINETSHDLIGNSQEIYKQAESLLLSEMGVSHFHPSKEKTNIKKFSKSLLASGRLDAEYYQPKYDDYLRIIQSYRAGYEPLQTACLLKDKNFTPEEKNKYRYIELSNIGISGDITGCTNAYGGELPSRARRKIAASDVVVSSIEGSLESCALVTKLFDGALCSTGFYVINSKKINPETLLVLFKSEPMQALLKQNCSGTILTAINKNEFLNIPVPIIDKDVQLKIQKKISESFALKEKAEILLNITKHAVEIAIEQDEATAEAFIQAERAKLE